MASVIITVEAQHQFHSLPTTIQARVEKIFGRLERWPAVSGAKALSGDLKGHYRIRTGNYRVQFHVTGRENDETVVVEKVGHRDGFYGD
jgi:mRNA-degrading endonuclease RelE of RelBE toxin-antitoxin system